MIDLIFFSFFVFLLKWRDYTTAGENISSFVFLKRLIECGYDAVDGSSNVVIEVDAIEIMIDIFDGSECDYCKIFIELLIVMS